MKKFEDTVNLAVLRQWTCVKGKRTGTCTGVVYLQVKQCDPHLSALEVRFSRRGATQIYVYLYLYM